MTTTPALSSVLKGALIIEAGDFRGEFAGMLLAALGGEVIKLEGPRGSESRRLGPFTTPAPEREHSLCFSRYNLGKKSVSLETGHPAARIALERLARHADIIIDSGEVGEVTNRLTLYQQIQNENPRLIVCTITPFGLDGPYRDLKMTDLTHLAMGGVMASCGYDPGSDRVYDTPPIAPAMWQSYHIACEHAVISILGALNFRELTGEGDCIDLSIHEAVSTCTEVALPTYIYNGKIVMRQTGRHAAEVPTRPWLRRTRDGRYVKAFMFWGGRDARVIGEMLTEAGIEHDLTSAAYREMYERSPSAAHAHLSAMIDELVGSMTAEEVFHRSQAKGLLWASVRTPEENIADPHFQARGSFQSFDSPEPGHPLYYPVSVATDGQNPLTTFGHAAPRLGEHNSEVLRRFGLSDAEVKELSAAGAI